MNLTSPAQSSAKRSRARRWGRPLMIFLLLPYVAIVAIFTLAQRELIYVPSRESALPFSEFGLSADEAQNVSMTTGDGLTLNGWRILATNANGEAAASDASGPPGPLLIYFPGNAGHRGYRVADFLEFTRHGLDVLVFDYRGYGENPGSPSQPAMQADARAVWRYAVEELDVPPSRIVLYGESMGGAVAVHLAAELCDESTPPAALITNATFASLTGTVRWHYPWFPFQFLLWDRWPSVDRMPHVTCPILMFHGARDEIVPLSQGRNLFAAAPADAKADGRCQFIELPASGHNDIPVSLLSDEISELLKHVIPERTRQ